MNINLLDERQGMLDCYMGLPPEENASAAYLYGYGKQYEIEQIRGQYNASSNTW